MIKDRILTNIDYLIAANSFDEIDSYIDSYIENLPAKEQKKKSRNREFFVQYAICRYLDRVYPDLIYISDDSGVNKPKFYAMYRNLLNKPDFKTPDLFICEPKNGYAGLYIEVKCEDKNPYKKDGTIKSDQHLKAQESSLKELEKKGYAAYFGIGFHHSIEIINNYINQTF